MRAKVIGNADVMRVLIEACASYAESWREHQRSAEFDSALTYLHLGQLSQHIVDLLERGELGELAQLARAIEQLHLEGTEAVREAVTIGLLEGLQNVASHRGVSLEPLIRSLGPESQRWWTSLNAFWEGRIPFVGADVVRPG